jgi:hypothetical protein
MYCCYCGATRTLLSITRMYYSSRLVSYSYDYLLRKTLKTIVRVHACTIQFEVSKLNNFIILTNLKLPEGNPKIDEDFRVSNS